MERRQEGEESTDRTLVQSITRRLCLYSLTVVRHRDHTTHHHTTTIPEEAKQSEVHLNSSQSSVCCRRWVRGCGERERERGETSDASQAQGDGVLFRTPSRRGPSLC